MTFDLLPDHVPGLKTWGWANDQASWLISFDTRFPAMGWAASRKAIGGDVAFIGQFPTRALAEAACRADRAQRRPGAKKPS